MQNNTKLETIEIETLADEQNFYVWRKRVKRVIGE